MLKNVRFQWRIIHTCFMREMSRRKQSNPAKLEDAAAAADQLLPSRNAASSSSSGNINNRESDKTMIANNVSMHPVSSNKINCTPEVNCSEKIDDKNGDVDCDRNNDDADDRRNCFVLDGDVDENMCCETDLADDSGSSCSGSEELTAPSPRLDSSRSCSRSDGNGTPEGTTVVPIANADNGTRHVCSVCRKTFSRASILNKHIQTHREHLEYICSFCPRQFLHKRSRDRHLKLHTGDKRCKCVVCGAAFARSDHLKIHLKVHENGKVGHASSVSTSPEFNDNHTPQAVSDRQNSSEPSPNNETHPSYIPLNYHSSSAKSFSQIDSLTNDIHYDSIVPLTDLDDVLACCVYCRKSFPSLKLMYQHIGAEHRSILNSLHQQQGYTNKPAINDTSVILKRDSVPWNSLINYQFERNLSGSDYSTKNSIEPTDLTSRKRPTNEPDLNFRHKSEKRSKSYSETNEKPCICSYCNIQVPNFKSFLIHMETHVSLKKTTMNNSLLKRYCPICGESGQQGVLEFCNHVFTHAISLAPGKCCHPCKKSFDLYENLQKHLYEKHSHVAYKCNLCSSAYFDSKAALQSHFTSKHVDNCEHYKCNICPEVVFHDRTSAENHISEKHTLTNVNYTNGFDTATYNNGLLFKCSFCQKSFPDEYLRHLHQLKDHHEFSSLAKADLPLYKVSFHAAKLTCDKCSSRDAFSSQDELATHIKLHHSPTTNTLKPMCSSESTAMVSLRCAYCNENCKSRNELESHMKTHHVSCANKDKHKCNICDEIYSSALTLAEHKLSHCKIVTGSNCSQCKAELGDEETFYNHQMQHNNATAIAKNNPQVNLPANCIICSQTLQTNIEIRLHAKFHLFSAKREFVCEVCKRRCDAQSEAWEGVQFNTPRAICRMCACKNGDLAASVIVEETGDYNEQDTLSSNHSNFALVDQNRQQFRCYICSLVCPTAIKLQAHMEVHSIINRLYDCGKCHRKFYFEADLESHMYNHKACEFYSSTLNYPVCDSKDISTKGSYAAVDKDTLHFSPKEEPVDCELPADIKLKEEYYSDENVVADNDKRIVTNSVIAERRNEEENALSER